MNFQFLHNNQINKQRWNECVEACSNGLLYAHSFYLDNICPGWKALAAENYEWVLPLTHRTKFGFAYLYQPAFTQQLGIFDKENVSVPYPEIIKWLQHHYKFWEINWNYSTEKTAFSSPVQLTAKTNFVLDLSKNYESLASGYESVLIKNLKRSKHQRLVYEPTQSFKEYIDLYRRIYGDRFAHVTTEDFSRYANICLYASQHNMIHGRRALDENGKTLAFSLFLADTKRLYNIINATTEPGRKMQANHFLFDNIIREFSGRKLLLDFEGSDVPGVKSFYKNFGAVDQSYYLVKYNALPWFARLFKK